MSRTAALLMLLCVPGVAQVTFQQRDRRIEISLDGKPFSNLYYGEEWAMPFLHPLRAASGLTVTRGYPVEKIAGESDDHIWHHGLWFAHGDINGVDFWRDLGREKTGVIAAAGAPAVSGDSISGIFRLVTPAKAVIGTIAQSFRFSAQGNLRVVDIVAIVRADQKQSLKLGDTEEGTLGLRFRDEFRQDRGAVLMNSDGLKGTENIWGRRAGWVDYSTVAGEQVGVTLLDHPSNPKYPTYWHARGYGLCAANPFGEHDFHNDPKRDGSMTVPAGQSMTFRYRVVIHPGLGKPEEAARWAAEFAKEAAK